MDESCSGTADDGYVVTDTSCGVGECSAAGQLVCNSGTESDTCAAGTPAADNNCNGLDESCSGTADDGYVVTDTSCGVGECSAAGQLVCNSGTESDTCAAGTPAADNNCNGLDESCSGTADDGYVVTDTSCGVGRMFGRWSAGM